MKRSEKKFWQKGKKKEIIKELVDKTIEHWCPDGLEVFYEDKIEDGYSIFAGLDAEETVGEMLKELGIEYEEDLDDLKEEVEEAFIEKVLEEAEKEGYEVIWHAEQIAGNVYCHNGYWTFEKEEDDDEEE